MRRSDSNPFRSLVQSPVLCWTEGDQLSTGCACQSGFGFRIDAHRSRTALAAIRWLLVAKPVCDSGRGCDDLRILFSLRIPNVDTGVEAAIRTDFQVWSTKTRSIVSATPETK